MNTDILSGKWKQLKGELKEQWGDLTDDELSRVEGQRDKMIGLLQEKYGYARDRAERELDQFLRRYDDQY